MTAKPIAVVYLPMDLGSGKNTTWGDCHVLRDQFEKEKPDYYWLVLLDPEAIKVEIKVFYEKDFTPIQYEELKSLITNAIKQTKTDKL